MRTTVTLDDELMRTLKRIAHQDGTTLRAVFTRLLRAGLSAGRSPARAGKRYRCPTFDLGSPRMDLDRALGIAGQMEDEEIARKMELRK